MEPLLRLETIVLSQFGLRLSQAVAVNSTEAKLGPSTLIQVQNKPAFGLEPNARSMQKAEAAARLGTVMGYCNAKPMAHLLTPLAEYALNQLNNLDFYDISLVDGFNVPMDFSPLSGIRCRGIRCAADITGQCPNELKAPGGCNNPCTVFKTDQYCCNSGKCVPTNFSKFFKQRCPNAYSYPKDDQTSTFTCPGGTNYKVTFCPSSRSFEII